MHSFTNIDEHNPITTRNLKNPRFKNWNRDRKKATKQG